MATLKRASGLRPFAYLALLAGFFAVAFGASILLAGNDERRSLRSYYLEATLDVKNTQVAVDEPFQRLHAWYESPARWRREYAYADERRRDQGSVQVSNGTQMMTYDGRTNAYSVWDLDGDYRRLAGAIPGGYLLGPLPASVKEMQASTPGGWQQVGTEKMLGNDVTVFRTGPSGSPATIWVDLDHDFVLRYASNDGTQAVSVLVTSVAYNQDVPDSQFQLMTPGSARNVDPPRQQTGSSSNIGPIGGTNLLVPAGFLTPAYLPAGYETTATSMSGGLLGQPSTVGFRLQPFGLRSASGPFLAIDQQLRSGGMPESSRTGAPVDVAGGQGYLTSGGDEQRLVFALKNMVVTIRTNVLPAEELQRIAESMR